MYKIIGADQKEYGPVTGDQIRHWLAEGRVNGQTKAQAEGTQEWKTIAEFPEFGLSAPPPSIGAPASFGGRDAAADRVKGPAIALIVTSILNIFIGFLALFKRKAALDFYANNPQFSDPQVQKILQFIYGPMSIATALIGVVMSLLILLGAFRILNLKNHALAMTGAVLAVIPCLQPCCGILTIPFGIWALVVLNKPEVRSHFD